MYNYAMATLLRQSQAFSVPLFPLVGNVFAAAAAASCTIAARWGNGKGYPRTKKPLSLRRPPRSRALCWRYAYKASEWARHRLKHTHEVYVTHRSSVRTQMRSGTALRVWAGAEVYISTTGDCNTQRHPALDFTSIHLIQFTGFDQITRNEFRFPKFYPAARYGWKKTKMSSNKSWLKKLRNLPLFHCLEGSLIYDFLRHFEKFRWRNFIIYSFRH